MDKIKNVLEYSLVVHFPAGNNQYYSILPYRQSNVDYLQPKQIWRDFEFCGSFQ